MDLQKRLDHWVIFGEEYPFLGTDSGSSDCSEGDCVSKGMKLLGNFSGPFQIEVSFLKSAPVACNMMLFSDVLVAP